MSNLKTEVLEILERSITNDYKNDYSLNDVIKDVVINGCRSGCIYELMFYETTIELFNKHREEIADLIANICYEKGKNILTESEGFIQEDPLCSDDHNKNFVVWFAFEEVTREIRLETELNDL